MGTEPTNAKEVFDVIGTGLSYLDKEGTKDKIVNLMNKICGDMDDLGYEPGQDVIDAYVDLENHLDELDEESESSQESTEPEVNNEETDIEFVEDEMDER